MIRLPEVQSYIKKREARLKKRIIAEANHKSLLVNCLYNWQTPIIRKTLIKVKEKYTLHEHEAIVFSACDAAEKILNIDGYFSGNTVKNMLSYYVPKYIENTLRALKRKGLIKRAKLDNLYERKQRIIKNHTEGAPYIWRFTSKGMELATFMELSTQANLSEMANKMYHIGEIRKDAIENLIKIYKAYAQDGADMQKEVSEMLKKLDL